MNCPQAEILIEDYNDGELEPKKVSELEAHLASCVNCSRLLESLRLEDRLYEDYGKSLGGSLDAAPSMWQGIRRGVERETRAARSFHEKVFDGSFAIFSKILSKSIMMRQLALASILVIASVCGTLLVIRYHQRDTLTAGKKTSGQATESQPRDLESALLSIKMAEQEYVEAIGTLSGIVDRKRNSLDPTLAAELEKNLKAIDEAIASSRSAYHAHPANPELARHMLKAYQKKVELLQDLALSST